MFKSIRLLSTVSRPEFLPANLGSLIMGLSWGIRPTLSLANLVILVALSFAIITIVSTIGAQLNTMFDYYLDSMDKRKKRLVHAMKYLGVGRLKSVLIIEFLLCVILLFVFIPFQGNPNLLFLWIAAIFLIYVYSAPPIRLKSRFWLSMFALCLVLSVLPILFIFYTFTSELNPLFLIFLTGQTMTVYGLIIPTEIRDYFVDSAMGVKTMTVGLGLINASLFGIVLLSAGGILSGTAFFLVLTSELHPILNVFLLAIAFADYVVLKEYKKIYSLSKEYMVSRKSSIAQDIIKLSANNPQWITLVSQAIVFMSLVLLVGKFLL